VKTAEEMRFRRDGRKEEVDKGTKGIQERNVGEEE
jgi:hypothetical protein